MQLKKCKFCEKEFKTENSRKEYCNGTCRFKAFMDKHYIKKETVKVVITDRHDMAYDKDGTLYVNGIKKDPRK